jgi:hypothetical protein
MIKSFHKTLSMVEQLMYISDQTTQNFVNWKNATYTSIQINTNDRTEELE